MWEIYAYQNADSLFGIFNAAAAIHGSGDYMAAVAAVAFCGFIAALVAYAFAPEKLQGWKWLATVLLVFSVLIVPRVTVGVVDKTGGSAVKVVANVPFGVAFLGSVTSTVGHTLTGLFETAFQVIPGVGALPSELSYEKNGLMFGNRLIRETGGVAFQDPNFRTDLVNFIHNCTMYDLIDGTVDPGTFSSSDDVWALMASPNPARFTTLTSAGGSITVDTCPNAYTNLNGRLPAQLTRIQGKLALPAESDAAGGSRQLCHRRADPAGLPEEQHCDRGRDGGRPDPPERGAECDQRHQQHHRSEGERPGGHGAGRRAGAVRGAAERGLAERRQGRRAGAAGVPQRDRGHHLRAVPPPCPADAADQRTRDHAGLQGLCPRS
jgi:hypothetical protein